MCCSKVTGLEHVDLDLCLPREATGERDVCLTVCPVCFSSGSAETLKDEQKGCL